MHRVSIDTSKRTIQMDKFKNKYRIPSARLQNWDYGSPGLYFITICTKDRIHYFGEIENDEMVLYELGLIVNAEWEKTLEIRPDMNLELGEFITMPNHFHAIIMIGDNRFNITILMLSRVINLDHNQKI